MATHESLSLSAQFARHFKANAESSILALCSAICIVSQESDWNRTKAGALAVEAVAAALSVTIDTAGSLLYQGDDAAKRAMIGARKLVSFAARIADPSRQDSTFLTVRTRAMSGSPDAPSQVREALANIGLSTVWHVEVALRKPASEKDTSREKYLESFLKTLVNLDAAGERDVADWLVGRAMDYLSGDEISFSRDKSYKRQPAKPATVEGADLHQDRDAA